jgi:nickel/cobalt exporter
MNARRLLLIPVLGVGALLSLPSTTSAHPLGNFTINHYTGIVVSDERITLRWVLDMAEIPAFSARRQIDLDGDGTLDDAETAAWLDATLPGLIAELDLRIDGSSIPVTLIDRQLSFPAGQGGLSTLRLVVDLGTNAVPHPGEATYTDRTYPERIGWHEIVVAASGDTGLLTSNAPAAGVSDELRRYPADALTNPVTRTTAAFSFDRAAGGPASTGTMSMGAGAPGGRPNDPLADLVGGNLTFISVGLAMLLAIGLGAAHAISPGHGKTLVAAYLIGSRGSLAQAIWLGVTVAVTHTVGVFVLGVVTLLAAEVLVPERLITWLSFASGLLVIGLGASLLWRGWRARSNAEATPHHHAHDAATSHHQHGTVSTEGRELTEHHHWHPEPSAPSAAPTLSRMGVAGLGLVGGMVPSASALLVLLVAITTGRILFGLALILAFGLGMAVVLAAVSASVVIVRRRADLGGAHWTRHAAVTRAASLVPIASGVLVLTIGVILSLGAVRALG